MIFREEDFSAEEARSVALLVERRAADCGRNEDGTFGMNNDCQEDAEGISGNVSPFAKSRTPTAKKEGKKSGGGDGEIKLGNVRRQDTMLRGGKSVAVIDSEAKERAIQDRERNPMPAGSHPASTADLYDREMVQRGDPAKPAKITSYDPAFTESDLAQNGMFIAHESVARLLTSRHESERRAAGGEGPAAVIDTRSELSEGEFEYVVSAIKQDVDRAYEEGRNPGFYSTDIAECMEIMSGFYPELSDPGEAKRRGTTPEDASFVFTMITAITSNGTDPALNLESADRIYRLYREHGSVRTPDEIMGGERAKEIKNALNRFQDMIDEFGESRVRSVLSGVTHASTVTRTMKKLSRKSQEFGGSWSDKGIGDGELADEVVPVAAVFGPKIGSFFANLSGKHQFLTMDRWLMRSVGRVTGELITRSTPRAANKQANAALKAIRAKSRSRDILFGVDKPPLNLKRDDVIKSLELQARTGIIEENGAAYEWAKAAQRAFGKVPRGKRADGTSYGSYGVDEDPQIHAAHSAGNTMAKSLIHEQQDPRSPRARRVIREVFREVAKRISPEGKVQVSEIQAVLWQYEQNLWKRLGAKTKIEGDSLYSAAAKALRQRRDSGGELVALRPEKQRRPKSVRSADGAAGESVEEFDYQNQSGQDLWDNEFENAEVSFIDFIRELLKEESPQNVLRSIVEEVRSARDQGRRWVVVSMSEGRSLWPRMGFDAPLPSHLRQKLPESLSHARTVIDLNVTRDGARWWRDNGEDIDVALDVSDAESPQNRAFDAFVRVLGRESRDLPVAHSGGWLSPADAMKFDELWDELDEQGVFDDYDSDGVDFSILEKSGEESRSADCDRTESGRFAAGNDCASGDGGYRGRHKAPRADGYAASADSLESLYPDDVYSKDGGRLYGHGDPLLDNESAKIVQSLKGKPDETVRIFRAVPEDAESDIHPGDWVTINEKYAKQHGESSLGGRYKIVSMVAPARHIFNDGNGIHEWGYDPKPKKDERAFCPTGEDGGIDNSCGPDGKPASDSKDTAKQKSSGGWGRDTQKWGGSSETEIWTPDKPLFSGAENIASISIERPNEVRDFIGDALKMSISDVVLASGAVVESPDRALITRPRVSVRLDSQTNELRAWWTSRGVSTGDGYTAEEKQYAPRPGTAVSAAEVVRSLSLDRNGPVMTMESFFLHPDFQGKGVAMESVLRSTSIPVSRIKMTTAARYDSPNPNRRMTGYRVWPKYGYDAPIDTVLKSARQALPKEFSRAKTILDLFAIPGGQEWWADVGRDIPLTFDNRPRSRSREVLLEYQDKSRRKNKRSVDVSKTKNEQLGTDSDSDEVLDEVWAEIQKKGFSGQSPSEADWKEWEEERTDGSSGEVRSH